MQNPGTHQRGTRIRTPVTKMLLVAAAALTLAGCASSDRMMRVSPMSEPTESSMSKVGARDASQTLREDRVNAFPLAYINGPMHSVLWPFIDWDDRGLAVRPFYNREGKNESVLFPFTGWDDQGGWALTTVWDDHDGWLVLPLAGSWKDTTFIGPAHWSDDGSHGVFPLWNSEPKSFWLAELYASSWHGDGSFRRRSLLGTLYWQDSSSDGADRSLWVFPVGLFTHNGANHGTYTALFSSGVDRNDSWMNIHPLWWSGENSAGSGYSLLLPLWYREYDQSGRSLYTPFGGAAYDTQGKPTTVNALGCVYHWSTESSHDYRHVLWPLYASIDTHKTGAGPDDAFAFVTKKSGGGLDSFRITPLFSTETGAHDTVYEWLHLLSFHEHGDTSGFALTPIFAHTSGEKFSDTRVFPFWRQITENGETNRLSVFPFYACDKDPEWYDYLTHAYVISDRKDDRDSRFLILFRSHAQVFPWNHIGPVSRETESGLSYTHETTVSLTPDTTKVSEQDLHDISSWLRWGFIPRLQRNTPIDGSSTDTAMRAESKAEIDALLTRHGFAPANSGDEARKEACLKLLEASTRKTTETRFAIDPFFIPLFDSHSSETGNDWSVLFGFAHSTTEGDRTKTSVLRYLYNRESGPDGTRMNCFPFIQSDESKESSSFAFLWRVFDKRTDKATGETKGHILFIPY